MSDIILEAIRAVIIGGIFVYLWLVGKKEEINKKKGWIYILSGFALLLFGMIIGITDNLSNLSKYIVFGNTAYDAFLEKVIGYLCGSIFLAIGFRQWMPTIIALSEEKRTIKESYDKLEVKVGEHAGNQNSLHEQLKSEIKKRKRIEDQLQTVSLTDDLTGIYNRRGFFTLAQHQLKVANRLKKQVFLLYADLDNFKDINDKYGHLVGDAVLIDIADIFKKTFRDTDIIARMGGDEFTVMLVSGDNTEKALTRLHENLGKYNKTKKEYKLSISIGITECHHETSSSIEKLLSEADKVMSEQKKLKKKNQPG